MQTWKLGNKSQSISCIMVWFLPVSNETFSRGPSLGRFKPEPLPVEPSGFLGHKTVYPPCPLLVTAKEQLNGFFFFVIIIYLTQHVLTRCFKEVKYSRGLWKRITIFLHFSCKPYMRFNLQSRIGMNQLLIWLHYHATLLMTSHGYIQHPAPFCTISWSFFDDFCVETVACMYHISNRVYIFFSN